MATLGSTLRKTVRNLISNKNIRSSITLTPVSKTIGSEGGYGAVNLSNSSSRTVYFIQSSHLKHSVDSVHFGEMNTGDLNIIIRDDESVDVDDFFTLDSLNYSVQEIRPIFFNEFTIAQQVVLSKRLA